VALTQLRAAGAHTGARYGSFAGRAASGGGTHPVGVLTQPLAHGAHASRRYGGFGGRGGVAEGEHPVGVLTQLRAFGAATGMRYGSFAGRTATVPPAAGSGYVITRTWLLRMRERRLLMQARIGGLEVPAPDAPDDEEDQAQEMAVAAYVAAAPRAELALEASEMLADLQRQRAARRRRQQQLIVLMAH
jgi:hypothetical protein